MKTKIIGCIGNKINPSLLEKELNLLKSKQGYIGFGQDVVGILEVYPLWNSKGDAQDGQYSDYLGAGQLTKLGQQLEHIADLIKDTFFLKFMKFARIFELHGGACILPHRDYLELETSFTRIHIPLKTNDGALYANEMSAHHLRVGEIWLHEGNLVHSVINFCSDSRLHLILDFDSDIPIRDLFKDKSALIPKTKPMVITRKMITDEELSNLYNLNKILNFSNLKEILVILTKITFEKQFNPALVYDWLENIAIKTGNQRLILKSQEIKHHFIGFEGKDTQGEVNFNFYDNSIISDDEVFKISITAETAV